MSGIQTLIYDIFHNNSIKPIDAQYYLSNNYENQSNMNLYNIENTESILLENIKKYSTFIYSNLLRLFLYDSQINKFYGFNSRLSKYIFLSLLVDKLFNYNILYNILKNYNIFNDKHDEYYNEYLKIIYNTYTDLKLDDISKMKINEINIFALSHNKHAFGIMIHKIDVDRFNFYILNSGYGSENHEKQIQYVDSILCSPAIIEIKDIQFTQISEFIKYYNQQELKDKFHYDYIYSIIKMTLKSTTENTNFYFIESQNEHNCTFYLYLMSLFTFIKIKTRKYSVEMICNIINIVKLYLLDFDLSVNITVNKLIFNKDLKYSQYYEFFVINENIKELIKNDTNKIWTSIYDKIKDKLKTITFINKTHGNIKFIQDYHVENTNDTINLNDILDKRDKIIKLINKNFNSNNFTVLFTNLIDLFDITNEIITNNNNNNILLYLLLIRDNVKYYINLVNKLDEHIKLTKDIMINKNTIVDRLLFFFKLNRDITSYKFTKVLNEKFNNILDTNIFNTNLNIIFLCIFCLYNYFQNISYDKIDYEKTYDERFFSEIYVKNINDLLSCMIENDDNYNNHKILVNFFNKYQNKIIFGSYYNVKKFSLNNSIYISNQTGNNGYEFISKKKSYIHNADSISYLLYCILCTNTQYYTSNKQDNDIYLFNPQNQLNTISSEYHSSEIYPYTTHHLLNIFNIINNTNNKTDIVLPTIGCYYYNDTIKMCDIDEIYINKSFKEQYFTLLTKDILLDKISIYYDTNNKSMIIFTLLKYISYYSIDNDLIKTIQNFTKYKFISLIIEIYNSTITEKSFIYLSKLLFASCSNTYISNIQNIINFEKINTIDDSDDILFATYIIEYIYNNDVLINKIINHTKQIFINNVLIKLNHIQNEYNHNNDIYFIKKSDIDTRYNYNYITVIDNLEFYHTSNDITKSYISQIQYINLKPHPLFKSISTDTFIDINNIANHILKYNYDVKKLYNYKFIDEKIFNNNDITKYLKIDGYHIKSLQRLIDSNKIFLYIITFNLFRYYLLNSNLEIIGYKKDNKNYMFVTSNFKYKIYFVLNDKSDILNIKIKSDDNSEYYFNDYYLNNLDKIYKPYLIDTHNLYFIKNNLIHIFFVSQNGHNTIKINPNGLLDNEPNKTTVLYFLDCIASKQYYNLSNIYASSIGFININKNNITDIFNKDIYQIIESFNNSSKFIMYFINRLYNYIKNYITKEYDDFDTGIKSKNNLFICKNKYLPKIFDQYDESCIFNIKEYSQHNNVLLKNKLDFYISKPNPKTLDIEYRDLNLLENVYNVIQKCNFKFIDNDIHIENINDIIFKDKITIDLINVKINEEILKINNNINDFYNIYPDIIYNLLYSNINIYDYICSSININYYNKILNILNDDTLNQEDKSYNIDNILLNSKSIFIDKIKRSYCIFQLLFGNYIRNDQFELKNKILYSLQNEREIFSFIMGAGKTSVIAPLLTLDLINLYPDKNIFHIMPSSLTKASYFINMQNIYPIYQLVSFHHELDKIINNTEDIDKIFFNKINIVSDTFLKMYKISNVKLNTYINKFFNNIFIFDEIDELSNPLVNQLNITECSDDKSKFKKILDYTQLYINSLFSLESGNKELYNNVFKNENFYTFKNDKEYKKLFELIIKTIIKNDIYNNFGNIKNNDTQINSFIMNIYNTTYNNVENLIESDIFYNIYVNSKTIFKNIRNVTYGLSKKYINSINDVKYKIKQFSMSIPYSAIDTPIYNSEFSNIYQKIIFTILSYRNRDNSFNTFSANDVYNYMYHFLIKNIYKSIELSNISDHIKYHDYDKILNHEEFPIEIILKFNLPDDIIKKCIINIFSNQTNILNYIDFILNQSLESFSLLYNISTTEFLLNDFANLRTGFTGTPNMLIPYDLNNQFKRTIEDNNDIHIKKSIIENNLGKIIQVQSNDLSNIIQIIKNNNYSVLIDSGAFFRTNIIDIVTLLYNNLITTGLFDCIVFINENHIKKIVIKKIDTFFIDDYSKNLDIPLNRRFYLFDHKHIIGQDFIIHRKAKGLVTIRHDSKLRDIAQGIFRLRQINIGQTVDLVITSIDLQITQSSDSYTDIYDKLKLNDETYLHNCMKLFMRHNIQGLIRLIYENKNKSFIINNIDNKCKNLINIFSDNIYIIRNFIEINENTYKKDIDTILITQLDEHIISNNLIDIKKIFDLYKKLISSNIVVAINTNIESEIEIQQEIETQIEASQLEIINKNIKYGYIYYKNIQNDDYFLKLIKKSSDKIILLSSSLFNIHIYNSYNSLNIFKENYLSNNNIYIGYIIYITDNNINIILLDYISFIFFNNLLNKITFKTKTMFIINSLSNINIITNNTDNYQKYLEDTVTNIKKIPKPMISLHNIIYMYWNNNFNKSSYEDYELFPLINTYIYLMRLIKFDLNINMILDSKYINKFFTLLQLINNKEILQDNYVFSDNKKINNIKLTFFIKIMNYYLNNINICSKCDNFDSVINKFFTGKLILYSDKLNYVDYIGTNINITDTFINKVISDVGDNILNPIVYEVKLEVKPEVKPEIKKSKIEYDKRILLDDNIKKILQKSTDPKISYDDILLQNYKIIIEYFENIKKIYKTDINLEDILTQDEIIKEKQKYVQFILDIFQLIYFNFTPILIKLSEYIYTSKTITEIIVNFIFILDMYMYYYGYLYKGFTIKYQDNTHNILKHIEKYTTNLNVYVFPHDKQEIIDKFMKLYEELFYNNVEQLNDKINKCNYNKNILKDIFYDHFDYDEGKYVKGQKSDYIVNIASYFNLFKDIVICGNESTA